MPFHETNPTITLADGAGEVRRFWLEIHGSDEGAMVPLPRGTMIVGASRRADVRVADACVSALHCRLEVDDRSVRVVDLDSRNGTYVGGARVAEARCGAGVALTLGASTLVVVEESQRRDEAALAHEPPLPGVVGASLPMRRLARDVRSLAKHHESVLVVGETGTGKELIARALHEGGPRKGRPFIALNVAALPRELVESELFGHERGAFTGATTRRLGAFAEAEDGTLFLDEIGELPADAQPKVLRALDGYAVRPVGGTGRGRPITARVVAATHVPLLDHVRDGAFRRDLFHRLEVFVLTVPPLRDRVGDVVRIARYLLLKMGAPPELAPSGVTRLAAHHWPGNVRELRNVLVRAAHVAGGEPIAASHVEHALRSEAPGRTVVSTTAAASLLREHDGNVSAAARSAGLPRSTFRKLLRRG